MPPFYRWGTRCVVRRARYLVAFAAALAVTSTALLAQQTAPQATAHDTASASRSQLEAEAARLEHDAQTASDPKVRSADQEQAAVVRQRLRDGDFQVGDRIAMIVRGDSTLSDTVAVRADRVIQLKSLPPISLQGVLHSELAAYLTKQLGQYLKNPQVQVTPLVQIAVVGSVGHPGFFWVPSDLTLTDAIMLAGGPTQVSDLNNTTVIRENKERLTSDQVQQAFASGTTLDQLDVRAGDQITVPEKGKHDWLRVAQIAAILAGLTVSILALSRH
jgi:protein involved in polysaccharide export with SLBB domain